MVADYKIYQRSRLMHIYAHQYWQEKRSKSVHFLPCFCLFELFHWNIHVPELNKSVSKVLRGNSTGDTWTWCMRTLKLICPPRRAACQIPHVCALLCLYRACKLPNTHLSCVWFIPIATQMLIDTLRAKPISSKFPSSRPQCPNFPLCSHDLGATAGSPSLLLVDGSFRSGGEWAGRSCNIWMAYRQRWEWWTTYYGFHLQVKC